MKKGVLHGLCSIPVNGQRKPAKLALNKGYVNRSCRGGRPGRPPNQQLTMCFAGQPACAPYSLCCLKSIGKIDFHRLLSYPISSRQTARISGAKMLSRGQMKSKGCTMEKSFRGSSRTHPAAASFSTAIRYRKVIPQSSTSS